MINTLNQFNVIYFLSVHDSTRDTLGGHENINDAVTVNMPNGYFIHDTYCRDDIESYSMIECLPQYLALMEFVPLLCHDLVDRLEL